MKLKGMNDQNKVKRAPPSITVDGKQFFSDRFYLNDPTGFSYVRSVSDTDHGDDEPAKMKKEDERSSSSPQQGTGPCQCHEPLPLFDRIKLISSLDLKAAIVGTYTLCPRFLSRELPMFFPGPVTADQRRGMKKDEDGSGGGSVPILVLHGTKGFNRVMRNEAPTMSEKEKFMKRETGRLKRQYDLFLQKEKSAKKCNNIDTSIKVEYSSAAIDVDIKIETSDDDDEVQFVDVKPASKEKISKLGKKRKNKKQKSKGNGHDISMLANKHRKKMFQMPSETLRDKWDIDGEEPFVLESGSESSAHQRANLKSKKEEMNANLNGSAIHFTEVQSCYIPQNIDPSKIEKRGATTIRQMNKDGNGLEDAIVLDDSDDDDSSGNSVGIDPEIAVQQQYAQGVYHPKFMLLFEKSGAIVVIISTANLTTQQAVDGSWVQRFQPNPEPDHVSYSAKDNVDEIREKSDGSDFGFVLSDFLQKQSECAKASQMLPIQFLRKYVNASFKSLDDFRRRYQFENSQVHLVSTVPGVYPGRMSTQHLNKMPNGSLRVLYGPQRVADILQRLGEKNMNSSECETQEQTRLSKPWLPNSMLSNKDRFTMQTTSFGSKWTSRCFEELVRQYMGRDDPDDLSASDTNMIEKVDIIWPTMDYMDRINAYHTKMSHGETNFSHFVFFGSDGFNDSEHAILSQMKTYDGNVDPSLTTVPLTPHIKTYARLLEGENFQGPSSDTNYLAWAMLSSACFSKGAQGHTDKKINAFEHKDEKSYSNFELAVLFVSRLQGDTSSDRLYSSYPTSCTCRRGDMDVQKIGNAFAESNVIGLPFPFKLRSKPYQPDPTESEFCETPFFDKLSMQSVCSGMCLQTPFGRFVSNTMTK